MAKKVTRGATRQSERTRWGTHSCVFDGGQVADLNLAARRIQLFSELVVKLLNEDGQEAGACETVSELVWTTIKDATAIQALVECGERTAKGVIPLPTLAAVPVRL